MVLHLRLGAATAFFSLFARVVIGKNLKARRICFIDNVLSSLEAGQEGHYLQKKRKQFGICVCGYSLTGSRLGSAVAPGLVHTERRGEGVNAVFGKTWLKRQLGTAPSRAINETEMTCDDAGSPALAPPPLSLLV